MDYTERRAENEGKMEIIVEKNESRTENYGELFSFIFHIVRAFINNVVKFDSPEWNPLALGEWRLAPRA